MKLFMNHDYLFRCLCDYLDYDDLKTIVRVNEQVRMRFQPVLELRHKQLKTLQIWLMTLGPKCGLDYITQMKKMVIKNYNSLNASIPSEIGFMNKLEIIDINTSGIRSIPSEIGRLINLKELKINFSHIEIIPPTIGQLINLRLLELYANRIAIIPPEIGQLVNLEVLDLNFNQISEVPLQITQLINLRMLTLSNNQLSQLPSFIHQLPSLNLFIVNHNPDLIIDYSDWNERSPDCHIHY